MSLLTYASESFPLCHVPFFLSLTLSLSLSPSLSSLSLFNLSLSLLNCYMATITRGIFFQFQSLVYFFHVQVIVHVLEFYPSDPLFDDDDDVKGRRVPQRKKKNNMNLFFSRL